MDAELPARQRASTPRTTWWTSPISCFSNWDSPCTRSTRRRSKAARSWSRTCAEGTPFVTLDGVERKLTARRPDDLLGRASDVHRRRLRRTGFGRQRHHDRRVYRERLFQPCVGAQDRQALRPEHRFFVPLRARRRSQHAGLCRQACRPADEGAGRGRDFEPTSRTSTPRRSKISASTSRLPASTR